MSKEQLKQTKDEFDALNGFGQYHWLVNNREKVLVVTLDNDNTSVLLVGDDQCDYLMYIKDDCGSRSGTAHLLTLLKIPNEFC